MATEHILVWLRYFKFYLINYFQQTYVAGGDYSEQHRFGRPPTLRRASEISIPVTHELTEGLDKNK